MNAIELVRVRRVPGLVTRGGLRLPLRRRFDQPVPARVGEPEPNDSPTSDRLDALSRAAAFRRWHTQMCSLGLVQAVFEPPGTRRVSLLGELG